MSFYRKRSFWFFSAIILLVMFFILKRTFSAVDVLPTHLALWSVIVAFLFSAAVGIFFGVYPARKASLYDPIKALRYE